MDVLHADARIGAGFFAVERSAQVVKSFLIHAGAGVEYVDAQTVFYDMMNGVFSTVLKELPEKMLDGILGTGTEDEEMSEPGTEEETPEEETMSESETETPKKTMGESEAETPKEEMMSESETETPKETMNESETEEETPEETMSESETEEETPEETMSEPETEQ